MDIQKLSVAFVYLLWLNPGQGSEMPKCAFEDTIDLSNARFMPDEGYYYTNGILVPLEQVTTYNYIETTKGHRVFHEAHPRGCILKDRDFISFCCNPSGEIFSAIQQGCYKIEDVPNGLDVNVTLKDGSKDKWNPLKKFNLKQELTSCGNSMQLTIENGEWNIFETGFVYLQQYNRVLGPNDYCLTPVELDYESWILKPVTCSQNSDYLNDNNNGYPLSGLISIPFLIMTILFYIIRPELRNLQGKCIICCLASKALSTTILFAVEISFLKFPKIICHSLGFIAYLFYESSFVWLSIIGYDMWKNAKTFLAIFNERKRFLSYFEFGWGIPIVLTTLAIVIRNSDADIMYKPAIDDTYCWWSSSNWSAMFYYFGLNAVILFINFVFCSLTFWKELPYLKKSGELRRYADAVQKNLGIYSVLLLTMSLTFSFKILVYVNEVLKLDYNNPIFYIGESVNVAEGPLIFIVLVVLSIAKKRRRDSDITEAQLTDYSPKTCGTENQCTRGTDATNALLPPAILITSQLR